MTKYAFGVDVGGTTIKLGLFQEDGALLNKWEIPTRTENQGSNILPDVAESIETVIQKNGILKEQVLGVGIGTPGAVDAEGTVFEAVNLHWDTFNIPERLEKLIGLPVKAGNDANIAALGEMWQGSGKGYRNLVAVTLGTGVGGGIITNGQIMAGAKGGSGEIGHIHVEDAEEEPCGCGCKGCLEQYASATGIARLARKHLEQSKAPSLLRNGKKLSAKMVFDAVNEGDVLAIQIAEEFGKYLGKGLAIVAAMANPQVIVIGGGVSKAGEILFDFIRPVFEQYTFPTIRDTEIRLASLGNDAGIYGAAGLFLAE